MTAPNAFDELAALTGPGGPYEMTPFDTGRGEVPVFVRAPGSLREMYEQGISDKPFLVEGDVRLTFREAYDIAAAIGHVLVHQVGVRPGDRVAISMRNHLEWMHAFAAATSIGAIAVAMNSLWTPEEMAFALRDSGASVLVADAERIDRARRSGAADGITVVAARAGEVPAGAVDLWARITAAGSVAMPEVSIAPDDPATILYTSGSTGNPKGVLSTHRNIISALLAWELDSKQQALRAQAARGATTVSARPAAGGRPVALLAVPLFHVLGLHAVYLSSYRSQRTVVSMRKWDPAVAAEIIERERVTSVSAPPAMTGDLVREAEKAQRDLSSLVTVGGGGAARAPEQVKRIDASFRRAAPSTGWGMTETSAVGTTIAGADYLARPTSAGRPLAVVQLRVVDELGTVMPAGVPGELQVRGTVLFREYWNRPDATAESFTDDGWFRTGDVALLDDEGFLFIVDRIKDLIIRGGENIGCGHVEAALLNHPDVVEAAVYAVPDERLGEEVGATVHATGPIDADVLRGYLGQHLAAHQIPRYITVHAEPLPRTGSGKLYKRQLRDDAVSRLRS